MPKSAAAAIRDFALIALLLFTACTTPAPTESVPPALTPEPLSATSAPAESHQVAHLPSAHARRHADGSRAHRRADRQPHPAPGCRRGFGRDRPGQRAVDLERIQLRRRPNHQGQ